MEEPLPPCTKSTNRDGGGVLPATGGQGKGFLCVTQLDCNSQFLRLFKSYQSAYLLSTLEHLLFPFIVQQNLNPSGFIGFKASKYCDSIRETSFLLAVEEQSTGEPFMTYCLEFQSQRRFVLLQNTRC